MNSKLFFTIGAFLSILPCFSSQGMEQQIKKRQNQRLAEERAEMQLMNDMELRKIARATEELKARNEKRKSRWDYTYDKNLAKDFEELLQAKKEETAKVGGTPHLMRINPKLNWLTAPSVIEAPKVNPLSPEELHYALDSQFIIQNYW